MNVLKIFAERLKELIDEKYNTVKDFSKEIQIPYTTISNWLQLKRVPSIVYLRVVCDFFNVSSDYLLGREN